MEPASIAPRRPHSRFRVGAKFLHSRYTVLGKLGYGSYSTVWLCRDQSNKYVAVKVLTRTSVRSDPALSRELGVYEHLSGLNSSHVGNAYIRGIYDNFELSNPYGVYRCLVHPPMHMSINALRMRARSSRLSEPILKQTLICLLQALDFLHGEANIISRASNIMLSIEDETLLTEFQENEQEHPSWRKVVDNNHVIYASRKLSRPRNDLWGQPVLCDLGEAMIGNSHKGNIQPDIYKAPEVQIWDIFENKHLFNALDEDKEYYPSHYVVEMVAYLGLPPLHFLQRSKWLGAGGVSIPSISMEESEENLRGQDKQQFLQFMRSMLQWIPEERKTAKELLDDPWLKPISTISLLDD
ncbi:kinase-like domain-containing protein [Aspergillus pseudocaelatus]|uniref:non-specific serine/threonine protein kinase n=1 Tax=Aspergillus pseudocaelatus TaxID=1825620 RepID=A0ABQ6WEL7_9EURO|nr:kinase-like domain-containing protein [Aspergillus pseudocaelatus]